MTNAVGRFLGGSPAMVALRLIVVSFVVGIVLETFGFDPANLLADAIRAARQIVELGFMFGRHDGDARAGFEETFGLAQADFARAYDEDLTVLKVEKDGVVLQFRNVARPRIRQLLS